MNKFFYSGRLAASAPLTRHGETAVCKFTLIQNAYAGKDQQSGEAKERVTSVQFTAFGTKAEAIAKHVAVGDELIIEGGRIENNNYTDKANVEHYGFSFIVDDFSFGRPGKASRERLERETASA